MTTAAHVLIKPTETPRSPERDQAREVAPNEARTLLREGRAVLVDVREPDEHARERISQSRSEPLSTFNVDRALSACMRGQRVIFHCKGGKRSADALRMSAPRLNSLGIEGYSLAGGIEGWRLSGFPIEHGGGTASISVMRQVQLTVGLAVLAGSALAWFVDPRFLAVPAFFGAGLTFAGATGTCSLASVLARMPWNRIKGG